MKSYMTYPLALGAGCLLMASFLPWWSIAIAAAAMTYLFAPGRLRGFTIAFLSTGIVFGLSAWIQSIRFGTGTLQMVSDLFMHAGISNLCLVAGLLAGITAGLGAWVGAELKIFMSTR